MTFSKTTLAIILVPSFCICMLITTLVVFPISKYPLDTIFSTSSDSILEDGNIDQGLSSYLVDTISLEIPITTRINLPQGYTVDASSALPSFITADANQLIIDAKKGQTGTYDIYLKDPLSDLYNESFYLELNLTYKAVDTENINYQMQSFLKEEAPNYGVYVYDLNRNISFGFNYNSDFRAASMVKIPIAITLMREVQDGNLSLEKVYPLRGELVFNNAVGAGFYPSGSPLTIRDYLVSMITESDNTSLSHIDAILSEIYGSDLNERIKSITGENFYVNPPEATANDVANVLKGLYEYSFLSKENSDYIISLMQRALPDLKEGIALGLPEGIDFANKIGFLDTDQDLSYMDSAIVYGSTTNYIVVIMDKQQDWEFAKQNIKQLSTIIYNNLN